MMSTDAVGICRYEISNAWSNVFSAFNWIFTFILVRNEGLCGFEQCWTNIFVLFQEIKSR